MRLKTVLVDDEQLARDELSYLLSQIGDVEIVGQAGNGVEALETIDRVRPDVVFLDIQMPGLTGFEVARRLLDGPTAHIIFVTAYDQHAIEAFEVNAVDYLLKPVDAGRLRGALQRAEQRISTERRMGDDLSESSERSHSDTSGNQIERIVELVSERQNRRERLAIKVGERLLLVQAEDIIHASLIGDCIAVVTNQYSGTSNYRTLDELHARLDPRVFWRVHRSHLVNINKIQEIVPWFSRNYILKMKGDKPAEIPVSRTQTRRLREYLKL